MGSLQTCSGARLVHYSDVVQMAYPTRLSGLAAARERYGERVDRLAVQYMASDTVADRVVTALAEHPEQDALRWVERACVEGMDRVPEAPLALIELMRHVQHVPFWVDFDRCERGGAVFYRSGLLGGVALGFGALARSYCSGGGNKPLMFTRKLLDRLPARIADTADYVQTVSRSGAMRPGQPGFVATVRLRLLHARVRVGLLATPAFRVDSWGVPINSADTAVTTLLFSKGLVEGVRRLGGHVSLAEEADLLHLWRYIGYLLGVPEELLATSIQDAELLADLVDTLDGGPDDDSRALLDAMLNPIHFQQRFPDPRVARQVRACYLGACRALLGDALATEVGVPPGAYDLAFQGGLRPTVQVLSRIANWLPQRDAWQLRMGERYWQQIAPNGPGVGRS